MQQLKGSLGKLRHLSRGEWGAWKVAEQIWMVVENCWNVLRRSLEFSDRRLWNRSSCPHAVKQALLHVICVRFLNVS